LVLSISDSGPADIVCT
jgi:hypothetical protein